VIPAPGNVEVGEYSIEEPSSVVTDRELALMRCLDTRFPASQHIRCRWHININVLAKTKRWFPAPVRVNGIIQNLATWTVLYYPPA
jgi:hypothetical protein